jgi:hypothetical protein
VRVKKSLALVKETGFTRDVDSEGKEIFYTEVRYPEEREHLLLSLTDFVKTGRSSDFGFHYDPYKFDSRPEKNFFEQVVKLAEVDPDQVEDIYFTGALTDPAKTGFFIDYRDGNGRWRRYTPDFVIRTKALEGVDPKVVIVEIKAEAERGDPIHGETGSKAEAVRRWEATNPERIKYHLLFTSTDTVAANHVDDLAQEWRDA